MSTYWQLYNLEQDPFVAEGMPEGHYISNQWQQTLELLVHLSAHSKAILLATGISGVGKTTLLRQFVSQVGQSAGICKVQGDASLTADVLRYLLAKHLGFSFSDGRRETFNKEMATQLERMHQTHRRYLLVVDDAHLLPERTLAAILDMATQQPNYDEQPFHIVLFGGPQVEATVADIAAQHMGEGITHTSRIKPMTLDETREYLRHRLALAGMKKDFPFDEQEVVEIFQHAGGIPAKVNFYARQVMEGKLSTKSNVVKSSTKKDKPPKQNKQSTPLSKRIFIYGTGAVTGLFVLLAGVLIFFGDEPSHEKTTVERRIVDFKQQEPKQLANFSLRDELNATALNESEDEPFIDLSLDDDGQDADVVSVEQEVVEPEIAEMEPVKAATPPAPTVVAEVQPKVVEQPKEVAPKPAAEKPVAKKVATNTIPEKKPKVAHVVVADGPIDSVLLAEKDELFISDPDVIAGLKQEIEVEDKFKPNSLKSSYPLKADKKMKQNANTYALQLMGSYEKQPLQQFAKAHGIDKKISYVHTQHNDKDWYVIVYGEYQSAQEARAAIKKLPKGVQAQHPWPRQLSSIQQPKGRRNS